MTSHAAAWLLFVLGLAFLLLGVVGGNTGAYLAALFVLAMAGYVELNTPTKDQRDAERRNRARRWQ